MEGTFRAHQVPLTELATKPDHLRMLEEWMKSYRPEELFDRERRIDSGVGRAGAQGRAAHGRQSARQRRSAVAGPAPARFPHLRRRVFPSPARDVAEATRVLGNMLRDVLTLNDAVPQLPRLRTG